jgi:uncharacterized protein
LILKRKYPESLLVRLRLMVWPRRSFFRSFSYFDKRILRLRATPRSIAIGLAAGVFAACSPLLGFHIVMALAIAWVLSGNLVAAALGTAFCNPLTFPLIVAGDMKLGALVLHQPSAPDAAPETIGNLWSLDHLSHLWRPVLEPMLVGSIPLGLACALIAYLAASRVLHAYLRNTLPSAEISR